MQKRVDTLIAEFPKDTFDAKKLDLNGGGKTPHEGMEHMAAFDTALLGVLKPEQREKLAAGLERMGNRPNRYLEAPELGPPYSGQDEDSAGARHER
jgi:hypothetical protein